MTDEALSPEEFSTLLAVRGAVARLGERRETAYDAYCDADHEHAAAALGLDLLESQLVLRYALAPGDTVLDGGVIQRQRPSGGPD